MRLPAHRLVLPFTTSLLLAACGPDAVSPDESIVLAHADRLAVTPAGELLVLGGGQVAFDRVEAMTVTKLDAAGGWLFHEPLPTGPRDGLHAHELRATPEGGALALTVQYDVSPLGLPTRSAIIYTAPDTRWSWRAELADASGPREARDAQVLADGGVLVAVGAELQTFATDGTLVARDDLAARLGITVIEELELLPGGELALLAGTERSPEDLAFDLDHELVVLEASGAVRFRVDTRQLNFARQSLFTGPGGELFVVDTVSTGDAVLSARPRLRAIEPDGSTRFDLELDAELRNAVVDGDELITLELRPLSGGTDEEGRPDDFGHFLVRRAGATGAIVTELFVGNSDDLGVTDLALLADRRVALLGYERGGEYDTPVLRFYRLP